MFYGVGSGVVSKTLCGYRWMESKTAQLEFGVGSGQVPDISIDSDGVICNCPAGTFYQSRIKPTGSSNQNPPPRLETCPPCSVGTYSPGGNNPTCSACPGGYYCVTPASAQPCPEGTYCPTKSVLPTSLSKGHYAVDGEGTFTVTGGEGQRLCEAGYSCDGGSRISCGEDELPNDSKSACVPCRTCRVGEGLVSACNSDGDQTVCKECDEGEFSTGGIGMCQRCGDNEVSNQDRSACLPCPVGQYRDGSMTACEKCPGNTFSGGGGVGCSACPENEVSNEAKSTCLPCPVGQYRDGSMIDCEVCPGNTFSGGGGVGCSACPENELSNEAKSACIQCDTCDVGYGLVSACNSDGNQTVCKECDEGEFSTGGIGMCQRCGDNEISNEEKSACVPCSACPAGEGLVKHCQGSNDTLCEACEEGMYGLGGLMSCMACTPGDFCPRNSPARRLCSKGNYCPSFSEEMPCKSGTYCPAGQTEPLDCVDGASCLVPASPELALNPVRIDIRESEAESMGGKVSYNMSLSAKPKKTVTVAVEMHIQNASCYSHASKFTLERAQFVFQPENYDAPQTVKVSIADINVTDYEGVFLASCHHSIKTSDEEFGGAFLRPVTINLQDDSLCPGGAQSIDEEHKGGGRKESIRKCGCRKDFFIKKVNVKFCDSVTECVECPTGMLCDSSSHPSGQILEEAVIEPEWYRLHNSSTNVVPCPKPSTQCTGNGTHGDDLCEEGHEGPFCMICTLSETVRYVRSGDECTKCSGGSFVQLYLAIVLGILFFAGGILYMKRGTRNRRPHSDGKNPPPTSVSERVSVFAEKVQSKYKVMQNTNYVNRFSCLFDDQILLCLLCLDFGHLHTNSVQSDYDLPAGAAAPLYILLGKFWVLVVRAVVLALELRV